MLEDHDHKKGHAVHGGNFPNVFCVDINDYFEKTMITSEHGNRRDQLLDLRSTDPMQVIALYRRAVGLNGHSMLPGGMDLTALVDSILDHEAETGRILGQPL